MMCRRASRSSFRGHDAVLAGLVVVAACAPVPLAGAPFTPNDPYYGRNSPSAGWNGQWMLKNQVTAGLDARVEAAWAAGWTGAGVVIGIVDDGVQIDHPDLAPNYSALDSYDFSSNDSNPSPVQANDNHGTPVAGIVAARGGNGIGVTGVAPYATLAGLRVDYDTAPSSQYASATLYRSSGLTRTIAIKNHSYGRSMPYVRDSGIDSECAAISTSSIAGTIHVFSAGNDRGRESFGDEPDANKKAYQATPDAIVVAAMGSDGTWSDYSNYGASVFVAAPSSSSKGLIGGITTDRTLSNGYNGGFGFPDSSYTDFGGTSAAAPVVSGVMALVKEAQPALDGRFAKHLLARTSDVIDQFDSTVAGGGNGVTAGSAWKTNAAGYRFNMNYGYGLIDAGDLVAQAVRYSGVTPRRSHDTGTLSVFTAVSDVAAVTQAVTVSVADPLPLEEIVVTLKGSHTAMGDLSATLTSPSGAVSRLMAANSYDKSDGLDWSFTTNAFWGESPNGTWRLTLADANQSDSGYLDTWSMKLRMGDLIPVAGLTTPTLQWASGAGSWFSSGGTQWSGGGWSSASQGVFTGTGGAVSVTASGVTASQGLRFETPGYTLSGGGITLGGVSAEANTITAVTGTTTIGTAITGKNAMRKAGAGTLVLTGSNSVSGAVTVTAGQLRIAGSGVAGNIVTQATLVFDRSDTATYPGTISGTGVVVKTGSGTLVVSGTVQHSGGTVVEAGTLMLTSTTTLPTSGTIAVADNAILAVKTGGGFFDLDLWRLHTDTKPGVKMSDRAIAGIDTSAGDESLPVTLTGSRGVAKLGAGTLTLPGNNTYTGPTVVRGGTLAIGSGGSSGAIGGELVNNAAVVFNHTGDTRLPGSISGTGTLQKLGTGSLTVEGSGTGFRGPVTVKAGALVAAAPSALGTGTLTLAGAAVHAAAGGIVANPITIASSDITQQPFVAYWNFASAAPATVSGSGVQVGSIAQGENVGTTTLIATTNPSAGYVLASGTASSGGGNANMTAKTGLFVTNSNSHFTVTLSASSGYTLAVSSFQTGMRSSTSGPKFVDLKSSADNFTALLATANYSTSGTFNGAWQALSMTRSGSIKPSAGAVDYRLYGWGNSTGTATAGVSNWQLDDLRISGTIFADPPLVTGTLGVVSAAATGAFSGPIVVRGTAVLTSAMGSVATFSGVISGSQGSVYKTGPGVVVLSGSHTYAGSTTVAGGELRVNGITAASSLVTVGAGATLAGSGTVGGAAVLAAASTLSPGASAGTLTVGGSMTWSPGGSYNWQMLSSTGTAGLASSWDLVNVGGSLAIAATPADPFRLNLWTLSASGPDASGPASGFDSGRNQTWRIASAVGGISGFAAEKFTIVTSARNGTGGFANDVGGGLFSLVQNGNTLDLVFTAGAPPSFIEIAVASGTMTQAAAGRPLLSGGVPFRKTGAGSLVLDQMNPLTGTTTVLDGALLLAHESALASSVVVPMAGGTVAVSGGIHAMIAGLQLSGSGLVDVGDGAVTVVGGLVGSDLVAAIAAGSGDGTWNGPHGITSSTAAADASVGAVRGVGWIDNGDGSITFSYAAPGDTNLDWMVDILDASAFVAGGKFNVLEAAAWSDGDFNYDGMVDMLDVANLMSTGLLNAGPYHQRRDAAVEASARAVPEPASLGLIVAVTGAWVLRCAACGRRGARGGPAFGL